MLYILLEYTKLLCIKQLHLLHNSLINNIEEKYLPHLPVTGEDISMANENIRKK